MNGSSLTYTNLIFHTQYADRLLSIYSLLLILIGTPCNLLCCLIYFQKTNRSSSIKTIFGYLAFLDTIVLYTFNLNYVYREFSVPNRRLNTNNNNNTNNFVFDEDNINGPMIKKNLEEYSLFICRFLSYTAFSTLQTSSWILAFGSFNRYLLIKKLSHFEFICKRRYTIIICLIITCTFFLSNTHILWMNGYRTSILSTNIICYRNLNFPDYMIWYQRVHLFIYSVLPSIILFVFNTLLMRIIFASKKRLGNHRRVMIFAATATTTTSRPNNNQRSLFLKQRHLSSRRKSSSPARSLNRHGRKLTISLIFITISYFTLTFPSTVIFSFFRGYIEPANLRRTLSLLFTNLSTTTHVIRFFIYFFCSTDFRTDFYHLFHFTRIVRLKFVKTSQQTIPKGETLVENKSVLVTNKTRPNW